MTKNSKTHWRIIKETGRDIYHFYLKEHPVYNRIFGAIKLQNLDLGIAMGHFESAAKELGLNGKWDTNEPDLEAGGLKYIASWKG